VWRVEYVSNYRRLRAADRHFCAIGVTQALERYAWPSSFTAPENATVEDNDYAEGAPCDSYDWNSNRAALRYLGIGLQESIAANDDHRTLRWCKAILYWGLGANRWKRPYDQLRKLGLARGCAGVSRYLAEARQHLRLELTDTENVTAAVIPYASSGLAKIHSLASDDGLVILDSRVGAALGECINHYLREILQKATIPDVLEVPRESPSTGVRPNRIPSPLGQQGNVNHPTFTYDYRRIRAQIRVSWLLHEVLRINQQLFPKGTIQSRAHKLEAALFMMGAWVGTNHHSFPN
jgi:hypothetical protein